MNEAQAAAGREAAVLGGSSKRDLLEFPEAVKDTIGSALSVAQFGVNILRLSPGRARAPAFCNAYRTVYTVRYVLHAFQKKSPKGIKTAKPDVELVTKRLKTAQQDYEERYGKAEA